MESVPPRGSGWVRAVKGFRPKGGGPTRYRKVRLTPLPLRSDLSHSLSSSSVDLNPNLCSIQLRKTGVSLEGRRDKTCVHGIPCHEFLTCGPHSAKHRVMEFYYGKPTLDTIVNALVYCSIGGNVPPQAERN